MRYYKKPNHLRLHVSKTSFNSLGIPLLIVGLSFLLCACPLELFSVPEHIDLNLNMTEEGTVRLSWNAIAGANTYQIYRSYFGDTPTYANTIYYPNATSSTTSYIDTSSLMNGQTIYYQIRVCGERTFFSDGSIALSDIKPITITKTINDTETLEHPINLQAVKQQDGSIQITWDTVSGASSYDVYAGTSISTYSYPINKANLEPIYNIEYTYSADMPANTNYLYFCVQARDSALRTSEKSYYVRVRIR